MPMEAAFGMNGLKSKAWFSLATQASENERRHKNQSQPRNPPFCSNAETRGFWKECFNWPDVANFLVLMLRFVFARRKRTQA